MTSSELAATVSRRSLLWPLLAIAPSFWLMGPLLAGHMPVSHDHPVHLFKAWQYWEHFLAQGRLAGWSHQWFFGYPVGELYPPGTDLWVSLFRAGTLAQLSWEHTYGLAFAAAFAFGAYALYRLGATFFEPTVGVGAAWLSTLDLGARREGGWIYTVEFGVWAQPLAMAFTFLGWSHIHRLLQGGQRRNGLWAAAWLALAFLTHPTTIILLVLGLPLYLIAKWWGERKPDLRDLREVGVVTTIAAALAGFWLVPFVARRDLTLHIGTTWKSLAEVATNTLQGQLFENQWPALTFLGLLAFVFALRRRRWLPAFLGAMSVTLVLFGTTDVSSALAGLHDAFSRIQFQRMTIPAKALWQVLVVWAVVELWRWAAARRSSAAGESGRRERALSAALLALIASAAVAMVGSDLVSAHTRSRDLPLHREVDWWPDFEAFTEWSRKQRETSSDFFRIAYYLLPDDNHLMSAPVYNGLPYYKVGYTPAKLFGRITTTAAPRLLQQLSVRYVVAVSDDALDPKRIPLVAQFGSIWVYELPGWRPQRHSLRGEGTVEELEMGDDRMSLRLVDVSAGSRLVLHVADHPRWEARLDGAVVPIERVPSAEPGGTPILMSVPARNGTLEIRWRARAADWAGAGLTLVGLLALLWYARRVSNELSPESRMATTR